MAEEIVRLSEAVTGRREIEVEKIRWVENLPGMSEFCEWLKTIEDDNIVTEKELEMYEFLKAEGKLSEDVENELKEYFKDAEDEKSDHTAYLEQLNEENEEKEKILNHLKKVEETLISQMKNCNKNVDDGQKTFKKESKCHKENCERLFNKSNDFENAFNALLQEISVPENNEILVPNDQDIKLFIDNLQVLYKIIEDIRAKCFTQEDSNELAQNYVKNHLDASMKTIGILENDLEEVKLEINWLEEAKKFMKNFKIDDVSQEEKQTVLKQEEVSDLSDEVRKLGKKNAMISYRRIQIDYFEDNKFLDWLHRKGKITEDFCNLCQPLRVLSEVYARLIETKALKAKASFATLTSVSNTVESLSIKYDEFKEIFNKLYSAELDPKRQNIEIANEFLELNQKVVLEEKLFFEKVKMFDAELTEVLRKVAKDNTLLLNGRTKMADIVLPDVYLEVEKRLKEASVNFKKLQEEFQKSRMRLQEN